MNFLAHSLFAKQDPELIVGQYCGDFVRGGNLDEFPELVRRGIRMHRAIDTYTDAHAANLTARRYFQKPYRRFAGIITDVTYDHFLARNWREYSDVPLQEHADTVYDALRQHANILPPSLQRFANVVVEHNVLASYVRFEAVDLALERISTRSRRFTALADAGAIARTLDQELSACFDIFFPDLVTFVNDTF